MGLLWVLGHRAGPGGVTVPLAGGHLQHEHAGTCLHRLESVAIYPLQTLNLLSSDLAVEEARHDGVELFFRVDNRGDLDVSDVGVAVVIDDRYSDSPYLLLPHGRHDVLVLVDQEWDVLEPQNCRANNGMRLSVEGLSAAGDGSPFRSM